ncbi:Glycosyltransferase 61 catalytic domain-containing protein [Plasmodiophora brassicae]|nr:hypothetical protein PBRA_003034 [Plasmodiophora brassicae]
MRWNDTNVIPQQITVVPSRLRKAVPPGFIGESFEGIPSEWTPKQVAIVETHEQLWLSGTTMTANVACTVFVGSHDTLQDLHSFPEVVLDSSNDFIVDEHVGVVVQFFYANWYHFVCDGMARIMLFRRRYPELKLLVPPRGIPHVDQVLEFFDLVEGVNLIHLPEEAPRRVALKRGGIFVDWVMVSKPTSIMEPFFPPASAIRDVRNYTCHRFKSPPARSIVFVGRKGSRRIDNENEVVDAMVQRFGPRVQLHDGDAMPVREQIEMFSKARIIIGAHGSGLVNIAFAPPTACLISFPIVPHTKLFFENLSSSLGIAHVILTSVPPSSWLGGFGRFPPAVIKELLATIDLVLDWQTSPSKTCRLTADYLMPPTCREETYVG